MSFFMTSFTSEYVSKLALPPPPAGRSQTDMQNLGIDTALDILFDHPGMISEHPYVKQVTELASDSPHALDVDEWSELFQVRPSAPNANSVAKQVPGWRQFEIVDVLPLPFGYTRDLVYHSVLRGLSDGMEAFTDPGSSVQMHASWNVKPSEENPGELLATETSEVRCWFFLMWYIKSSYEKSHAEMHDRLRLKWEKMMGERLGLKEGS